MANIAKKVKYSILNNDEKTLIELLNSGFDPNFEGGWLLRMAARQGSYSIVKILINFGANPHLISESGASTLQLAVYSGEHWLRDQWNFLLSCCDSSQLADGAAVAIIFHNIAALQKILGTGRCNANIPTTLTGKTVEQLVKGYKLESVLDSAADYMYITPNNSPRCSGHSTTESRNLTAPRAQHMHKNLSPSVANFFHQTASQTALTSPRNRVMMLSPTNQQRLT